MKREKEVTTKRKQQLFQMEAHQIIGTEKSTHRE